MPLFKQTCSQCGFQASASARFCPECGTALGGTKPCVHCQAQIPTAARYCPMCSRPQSEATRPPDVRGSVWRSGSDEFAVRIEREDLKGWVYKELEIQPGQQAIFLVNGRAEAERQGPGRYQVDSFFDKLLSLGSGRHVTALVVRGDPVSLEFQLPKLYTSDDFELGGRVVLAVQVDNPPAFFANVMRSQQTLTLPELRGFLFDQVRTVVQQMVGQRSLEQFKQQSFDPKFRGGLTTALMQHMEQTLADSGLKISQVVVTDFVHPRFDALRRQWEDIALFRDEVEVEVERGRAGLAKRQGLWEVDLESEAQETAEQRAQARVFEERAQVWEEMRRAVLSDKMNTVRSEEDLRDFMAQIDQRQTLRREQLDVLAEDFANRKEDRTKARAHLAYLAELERDYNRKQAELAQRSDFTLAQMAAELRLDQQRLADVGLLDGQRWQNDMAQLRRNASKAEWERAEQQKVEIFDRQREKDAAAHRRDMERAQTLHRLEMRVIETDADLSDAQKRKQSEVEIQRYEAERRNIVRHIAAADFDESERQKRTVHGREIEEDKADLELALKAMRELKATKREDLEGNLRITRQDELERQAAAHQRELERQAQQQVAEAQRQAHEVALLRTRAEMSAEALISLSGPDQARIIGDLKKTEAMKGLSDEQVYAMMAAQSPQVAQALAERFKAMQEQPKLAEAQLAEVRTLYDRMLGDIQRDREKEADLRTRTEERYQQMFGQALESQRSGMVEIARATSHAPASPAAPIVITGGGGPGYPQVIQPGSPVGPGGVSGGEVQICPSCRIKQPVGTKFCTNCGHQFFD